MRLPRPRMIANLAVTYRCDSRCRACGVWRKPTKVEEELQAGEIEEMLSENTDVLGAVESIQVTGGEPFLRDDLGEILQGIHRALPSCFIWVPTNGMQPGRIESVVREAASAGIPLGVSVSLDGGPEIHDHQRGVRGSFDSAYRTLLGLSKLKDAAGVRLSVGFTVAPANAGEVRKVASLADAFGADFSARLTHRSSFYYGEQEEDATGRSGVEAALRAVAAHAVGRRGLRRSLTTLAFLEGSVRSVHGSSPRKCTAGSRSFFLDPFGEVYPCLFVPQSLGNIREKPFRDVWGSEAARDVRKLISGGGCPGCWVECEAFRDLHQDYPMLLSVGLHWLLGVGPLNPSS